jgi:LysM repeat protein
MCPNETFPHRVKPQETLWTIANRYNTTVSEIMLVNPGLHPYNLRVGTLICIPKRKQKS